jgi:hypothetical protein
LRMSECNDSAGLDASLAHCRREGARASVGA